MPAAVSVSRPCRKTAGSWWRSRTRRATFCSGVSASCTERRRLAQPDELALARADEKPSFSPREQRPVGNAVEVFLDEPEILLGRHPVAAEPAKVHRRVAANRQVGFVLGPVVPVVGE